MADLGILLVAIAAHAAFSSELLLRPILFLAVSLGLLAFSCLLVGLVLAWTAYPQHRKAELILVVLTLSTLTAHLYIANAPSSTSSGSITGSLGALENDNVSVNSAYDNGTLTVTLTPTGGSALANPTVTSDGLTLSGNGFGTSATLEDPLQAGKTLTGTWKTSGIPTQIGLSYDALTCYDQVKRTYGCIMDESYYVPEAMGILAGSQCSTSGAECHMEHPFLSPALIAAGMAVFGEFNPIGWRIVPLLMGTTCIPLLFAIAWRLSGDKFLSTLSSLLLALDVMFFSQSSAALLDTPMIFFGLLAAFAYLWNLRVWKLDRYVLAGILLGLAGLAKETAIFFALGLLAYHMMFGPGTRSRRYLTAIKMAVVLGLVFSAGLQTYDTLLASPSVPYFTDQLRYMISYGQSLTGGCPFSCGWKDTMFGNYITPINWVTYYSPIEYYATSVTVCPNSVNGVCQGGQYSYFVLAYYGVTNFVETWLVFLWIPVALLLVYRHFRRAQTELGEFGTAEDTSEETPSYVKFAGFALLMFAGNYFSYLILFLGGRVTYPFYFVPAIPAMAMGAGFLITRAWFPRPLVYVYMALVFFFFLVFFPDKSFLPDWLRAAIGH